MTPHSRSRSWPRHRRALDVEDELDFQRTVAAIEKIPDIDSDTARELLRAELLREPNEYVTAASTALAERHPGLTVEGVVQLGHPLSVARDYVDRNKVGLIVLNTKDATQLAMHGEAYAMTVELRFAIWVQQRGCIRPAGRWPCVSKWGFWLARHGFLVEEFNHC